MFLALTNRVVLAVALLVLASPAFATVDWYTGGCERFSTAYPVPYWNETYVTYSDYGVSDTPFDQMVFCGTAHTVNMGALIDQVNGLSAGTGGTDSTARASAAAAQSTANSAVTAAAAAQTTANTAHTDIVALASRVSSLEAGGGSSGGSGGSGSSGGFLGLPDLTLSEATSISSAFLSLFAVAWVWRKLQHAI